MINFSNSTYVDFLVAIIFFNKTVLNTKNHSFTSFVQFSYTTNPFNVFYAPENITTQTLTAQNSFRHEIPFEHILYALNKRHLTPFKFHKPLNMCFMHFITLLPSYNITQHCNIGFSLNVPDARYGFIQNNIIIWMRRKTYQKVRMRQWLLIQDGFGLYWVVPA